MTPVSLSVQSMAFIYRYKARGPTCLFIFCFCQYSASYPVMIIMSSSSSELLPHLETITPDNRSPALTIVAFIFLFVTLIVVVIKFGSTLYSKTVLFSTDVPLWIALVKSLFCPSKSIIDANLMSGYCFHPKPSYPICGGQWSWKTRLCSFHR